jgi:copper homeostasis protein
MTCDPLQALEDCIEVGFDRILTSGQCSQAVEGKSLIRDLIKKADGRIAIMPGAGVNENTVQEIVSHTGAREIHFSATAFQESDMVFRNAKIASMGDTADESFIIRTVDPDRVRKIRALAESC